MAQLLEHKESNGSRNIIDKNSMRLGDIVLLIQRYPTENVYKIVGNVEYSEN